MAGFAASSAHLTPTKAHQATITLANRVQPAQVQCAAFHRRTVALAYVPTRAQSPADQPLNPAKTDAALWRCCDSHTINFCAPISAAAIGHPETPSRYDVCAVESIYSNRCHIESCHLVEYCLASV